MSTGIDPRDAEAQRQQRLMAGLLAPAADPAALPTRETGARALRGLQAYRANADASAARALATAFPTVQMLLGEDNFVHLARGYWRADPPLRGDLGEWGAGLADWITRHAGLAEWPYLSDCARLDWAMHACERAADSSFDADSIARLGDTDPSRIRVVLASGLAVLESTWPIAAIHAAHRSDDDAAFDAVRNAIAERRGETLLVARLGFKAVAAVIDTAAAQWTRQLLAGHDLATALEQAPAGFDFTAWLTRALQSNWVKGIRVLPD